MEAHHHRGERKEGGKYIVFPGGREKLIELFNVGGGKSLHGGGSLPTAPLRGKRPSIRRKKRHFRSFSEKGKIEKGEGNVSLELLRGLKQTS